ncbi:MAG: hypothetical protein JW715_01435 [Sedimentisphaerales bacterium]|nr:hypothetical protein [Sedimentisphaerales bacterium]
MDKKKPILLFYENLIEPIQATKAELNLIESEISLLNREFLRKGVFAYIFALFESSLSECLTRYLNELPSKLPMQYITLRKNKDELINRTLTYKIIESCVEEYIMNISYGTTSSFLLKFCELLSIDDVNIESSKSINEKKERRNLLLHNNLIINNKYLENTKSQAQEKGKKLEISKEYLIETINETREIISVIELKLSEKYSKFTKAKVIKDIWNYLFDSPILSFEDYWMIKDNEIVGFNSKTAKKWSNNYSSSERTLLALFLQNFNPYTIDSFLKFKDLNMFVSITSDKVEYILEVFKKYPLLLQNSSKRARI